MSHAHPNHIRPVRSNHGTIVGKAGADGTGAAGHAGVTLTTTFTETFTNTGLIVGGSGGSGAASGGAGGKGGAGVSMAGGALTSSGTITGGAGGAGGASSTHDGAGGHGGAGVNLTGGTLTSSGWITGGAGGASAAKAGAGGAGGAGVYLNGGTLIDAGVISGGAGGIGLGGAGAAGAAVLLGSAAGTLVLEQGASFNGLVQANSAVQDTLVLGAPTGTLSGLGATFTGFALITEQSGATWTLAGTNTLTAGEMLTSGSVAIANAGSLLNAGLITGATGGAGANGSGALANAGGTLTSSGTIAGGAGGAGAQGGAGNALDNGGAGATGVSILSGSGTNTGTITGGAGGATASYGGRGFEAGGAGGTGLTLQAGGFTNAGTIEGGAGGHGSNSNPGLYYGGVGGAGGAGVVLAGGNLTNDGRIAGALGGGAGFQGPPINSCGVPCESYAPGYGSFGTGGVGLLITGGTLIQNGIVTGGGGGYYSRGGAGVSITGGTVTNLGTIIGGTGGREYYGGGPNVTGGAGVYLNGGTLITAGTIAGGAVGARNSAAGQAIVFGAAASTLVLEKGAIFNTQVQANTAAQDTLLLGAGGGTLTGLGSEFTGFTNFGVTVGASWTIAGSAAFTFSTISLAGTLTEAGGINVTGTLILNPAFDLNGPVSFARGATLCLVGRSGVLNATGSPITGFTNLTEQGGSTWTIAGSSKISVSTLTAGGTLTYAPGFTVSSELVLDTAASIAGTVSGATGSQLLLAAGPATGTVTGLGTAFTGFTTIAEQAGATWSVTGTNSLASSQSLTTAGALTISGTLTAAAASSVTNIGSLSVQGGTLSFLGSATNNATIAVTSGTASFSAMLAGTGTDSIGAGGTLALLDGAGAGQMVDFLAASGALDLTQPAAFVGTIAGFSTQDSIDLLNTTANKFSFADNVLTLKYGSATVATLNFASGLAAGDFSIGRDGHGGTVITHT